MTSINHNSDSDMQPGLPLAPASRPIKVIVLFAALFIGLCLTSLLSEWGADLFGRDSREALLLTSAMQSLLSFILPAWICYRLMKPDPLCSLGLKRSFSVAWLLLTVLAMAVAVPALNEVIHLNESIKFSPAVDALFSQWEEQAQAMTDVMLSTDSVGGLIAGILIIGVLTGLGEEIFFRGALQPMLVGKGVSAAGTVWIAAIVFSIMHFQPYGFIPRVLLGAFFGYLYLWSGSIWLPATAHALNNSMVVLMTWLSKRGISAAWYEETGVADGFPAVALVSLAATSAVIFAIYKYSRLYGKGRRER